MRKCIRIDEKNGSQKLGHEAREEKKKNEEGKASAENLLNLICVMSTSLCLSRVSPDSSLAAAGGEKSLQTTRRRRGRRFVAIAFMLSPGSSLMLGNKKATDQDKEMVGVKGEEGDEEEDSRSRQSHILLTHSHGVTFMEWREISV
jgi:hypothetical protein